jgi:hypothetical protein
MKINYLSMSKEKGGYPSLISTSVSTIDYFVKYSCFISSYCSYSNIIPHTYTSQYSKI